MFGERDGDGDVVAPVAEQRAFWEREVKPQGFDVWGGVGQPGDQVFLQTGSDLRQTRRRALMNTLYMLRANLAVIRSKHSADSGNMSSDLH